MLTQLAHHDPVWITLGLAAGVGLGIAIVCSLALKRFGGRR